MKYTLIFLSLLFTGSFLYAQTKATHAASVPVKIQWVNGIDGDFSFTSAWSYPLGVEMKSNGKAGCADGGFCPERCYNMLDSNGIVLRDSARIFYQLLDTTHQFHSAVCETSCDEWDGTDFLDVYRINKDSVSGFTATGIATHCSLQILLVKNSCFATIDLNSITEAGDILYYCTGGTIRIDQTTWKNGALKADFNFTFYDPANPKKPIYWKGRCYSLIRH